MNSTDHNKILGIIHIAYGAFTVIVLLLLAVFLFPVLGFAAARTSGGEVAGIGIVALIVGIVIGVNLLLTVPEFVAGYALLKRKKWAKAAGVVSAILESLNFPFGTALCVYTLWFLFSDQGKALYDKSPAALPPPPVPQWVNSPNREAAYVPPSPSDWR